MKQLSHRITELIIGRLPLCIVAFSTLFLAALSIGIVDSSIRVMNERVIASSGSKINFLAASFASQLTALVNVVQSEATSPLIRNALSDSAGLEAYLKPHLASVIGGNKAILELALLDGVGTPIASLLAPGKKSILKIEPRQLQAIIARGETAYQIRDDNHTILIVPVWFPPTNKYEGVLVALLDLTIIINATAITDGSNVDGEHTAITVVAVNDARNVARAPAASYFLGATTTTTIGFALPAPFLQHQVLVGHTVPTTRERQAIILIILSYLLVATLTWTVFFTLARWVKVRYVEPVRRITAIAEEIARVGSSGHEPEHAGTSMSRLQQSVLRVVDVLNTTEHSYEEKIQLTFDELSLTRARLESIASSGDIIALSFELKNGVISYASQSFARLLPLPSKPNLHWRDVYRLFSRSERAQLRRSLEETLRHGQARFYIKVESTHGERVYDVRLQHVGPQHCARIDCIAFDNTTKAAAEMALTQSERRKTAIINGALDGFITLSPDLIITDCNPAAERILGRKNIELCGLRFPDHYVASESRQNFSDYCASLFAIGEAGNIWRENTLWLRTAAGKDLPVELSASLTYYGSAKQLCLYLKDLRATYDQQRAISIKNAEIDAIFTLSPDGLASFDDNGRLSAHNRSLCEILGVDPDHLKSGISHGDFWALIKNISHAPEQEIVTRSTATEEGVIAINSPKEKLIRYSKQIPRQDQDSQSCVYYFRDITREFQLDAMKSSFLATAAHELRTPLTTILGFSELLSTQEYGEQERLELANSIFRHSLQLRDLINDLLDLAKIEATGVNLLKTKAHDVRSILTDLFNGTSVPREGKRFIDRHEITLEMDTTGSLVAMLDEDKIRRAIHNLLSNAAKYSAASVPIKLSVQTVDRSGRKFINIRVTDHGIGMTPDELNHAFVRFWRADNTSGSIPGTGLGLSLVKEIVDMHHGTVDIASQYGVGTTVSLLLPAADETETGQHGLDNVAVV